MTSDLMGLSTDQLRQLMREHQAHRPADLFSPEMTEWMEKKDRLKFHLDLAEAAEMQAWKPAAGPAHPIAQPEPEQEPAAPVAQETPMSTPQTSPEERLDQLKARLAENAKSGTPTAASLTRGAIRRHCEEFGLPVPEEAQIRRDCAPKQFRKSAAKTPATAPKVSASPRRKAARRAVSSGAPRAAQLPVQGAQAPTPLPPPVAAVFVMGADPVDQLRQIRHLALSLLPDLEDLTQEDAGRAHDEMDLLAQSLVLGGKLIQRQARTGAQ